VEHDGHQHAPRGFAPGYLGFALVWSLIIPAVLLLLSSGHACQPLVYATLGPYLLVFVPQIALETKYLNRSFMTPVLPLLFMYYRLWQFVRSLAMVAAHTAAGAAAAGSPQQQHWLTSYLMSLLVFWVFDTGCTMLWLPWMYDWQLQDPALLQQLAQARQQGAPSTLLAAAPAKRRQLHPAGDIGASGATTPVQSAVGAAAGGGSHGMTTRSRARTPASSVKPRSRAAASHSSADIDSYGFGA
jgi:hypothetical protein